jgi:hypothetical protein
MAKVMPGRYTAQTDEPFVVFLIGMRINRFFAFRKWIPTALAMGPMLRTLFQHPEKGFLGGELIFYWRGVGLIQYWRSFEDLEKFARNREDPHSRAWQRFNKAIGTDGSVGIWHETYLVEPGRYEAVYGNMPVFGLASATKHVPAVGRRETARRRLGGENEPAVPTPSPVEAAH